MEQLNTGMDGDRAASSFSTTQWSTILSAGDAGSPDADRALALLCSTYWYPLYAHVRRLGNGPEEARDLTQGFFLELLSKRLVDRADPARGRFRSFLCQSLENFLHHQHERRSAAKRGGGSPLFSLDVEEAESRYNLDQALASAPAEMYEREWARTVLDKSIGRLRNEFAARGRVEFFERLQPHLWLDDDATPYSSLAREFNLTTVSVKVTVHRLRRRFGECLREQIAQTVARPEDVEDELRHLIAALSR